MKGAEQILGLTSWITTERMNVPEWFRGAIVDDEEWAAMEPYGFWVEAGDEAGKGLYGADCCSLRWFTAYNNGKYKANETPYNVSPWTPNQYLMKFAGGSAWCFEINSSPEGCDYGFVASASIAQVGMEAAEESEPENWGHDSTAAEWTNQTWHNWNFARYYASKYGGAYTTNVCVGQNGYAYPGWGAWGTC